MDYKLTNAEKETIINFNEAEGKAEIYTCNSRWMKNFDELVHKYPDEVRVVRSDGVSATYSFPKKWVKVRPSRILSDEQRELMSRRAREQFGHNKTTVMPASEG